MNRRWPFDIGNPGVRFSFLYALARVRKDRGEYGEARRLLAELVDWAPDTRAKDGSRSRWERLSSRVSAMGFEMALADHLRRTGDLAAARRKFGSALDTTVDILRDYEALYVRRPTSTHWFLKPFRPLMRAVLARKVATVEDGLGHLRSLLREETPSGQSRTRFEKGLKIVFQKVALPPFTPFEMADLFREFGWTREARVAYDLAIKVTRRRFGSHHPLVARGLHGLAATAWDLKREREALKWAHLAGSLQKDIVRDTIAALPERQALRLLATRDRPETILFSGLLMSGSHQSAWLEACWEWTLGRRAMILEELVKRNQKAPTIPEATGAWNDWRDARRRLAALFVRGASPGQTRLHESALREARAAKDEAESTLARISEQFRQAEHVREASLETIRRALPQNSALVEFVAVPVRRSGASDLESRYVALVLHSQRKQPSFADLGTTAAIDALVLGWHRRLRESLDPRAEFHLESLTSSGDALRQAIWDPVAAHIGTAESVFIVPDGSLNTVNFSALPDQARGFLAETGPAFHLLSSGRDVLGIPLSEDVDAHGVLAVGAPDYEATRGERVAGLAFPNPPYAFRGRRSECAFKREASWEPLPETGKEVQEIGRLFADREPVLILTGAAASEERFRIEAPKKRIVHVATHGFFLGDTCTSVEAIGRGIDTPARLSDEIRPEPATEDTAESQPSAMGENPLLLAGLILAGANHVASAAAAGDDGILTAEELAAIDLRGTEIVALSACDTGLGKVGVGEGVFGLRRAIEIAGARTVLMSLWPVPDRPAREWMGTFYAAHLEGVSVLESTRRANLDSLHGLRRLGVPPHPFLWACFVAAGDWR